MKVPRLNVSLSRYNDSALETKAQFILGQVDANEIFKNPTPAMDVLLAALSTYSDALTAAASGDRIKIAEKKKARKDLEALLRELAVFVTLVAKGDRAILISSGFDLQKESEPLPPVTPPLSFVVKSGLNPGEVHVRVKGAKNVHNYRHECTVAPVTESSVWTVHAHSKQTNLFAGLKTGAEHIFRSAASDRDGGLAYTKMVSLIVQ